MKVGDKCPQCNEGLLVRTEVGIECDNSYLHPLW
jgi:hypothetical protein